MTVATQASAQSYAPDPRNDIVEIYVNGQFFARDKAMVPVFDSGIVLGDVVWEGLRLVKGKLLAVDKNMGRHESATGPSRRRFYELHAAGDS